MHPRRRQKQTRSCSANLVVRVCLFMVAAIVTRRWSLEPLPGVLERDAALRANGHPPMGDLSAALEAAR